MKQKNLQIFCSRAPKNEIYALFSCLDRHFPVFWGEGVKTLARMVSGTYLVMNHQVQLCLGFFGKYRVSQKMSLSEFVVITALLFDQIYYAEIDDFSSLDIFIALALF